MKRSSDLIFCLVLFALFSCVSKPPEQTIARESEPIAWNLHQSPPPETPVDFFASERPIPPVVEAANEPNLIYFSVVGIITALCVLAFAFVLRKRTLGSMQSFDLISLLLVVGILFLLFANELDLPYGLLLLGLIITTFVSLNLFLRNPASLSMENQFLVVVKDGKFVRENLKKLNLTKDEILFDLGGLGIAEPMKLENLQANSLGQLKFDQKVSSIHSFRRPIKNKERETHAE